MSNVKHGEYEPPKPDRNMYSWENLKTVVHNYYFLIESCLLKRWFFQKRFPFLVSTQSGAAGLRQQVSGSEEDHSAAADRTPAALQQSGNGSTEQRCLWFTSRGQS